MLTPLTVQDIAAGLRDLGLAPGDSVIVHSSFRSLGPVVGGPEAVIDALLDAVGPGGNLMLPTFNYTRPLPEPYFDPRETPGRTGIIPEMGRQRPGAVRSLHPTHSVAAIGPEAEALTRDHLTVRAFGVGSPIDRLAAMGGKVLLLGVGHTSNSAIHVGEEHAGLPKAPWGDALPVARVLLPNGSVAAHEIDTSPSCSAAFGGMEHVLRRSGAIRDGRIGGCLMQIMAAADVVACACALIRERPDALLCTWPGCRPCTGARRRIVSGEW